VTGRIDSIVVHEGDLVRSGQLWPARSLERQARREQAAAQLAAASATLEELERGSRREEVSRRVPGAMRRAIALRMQSAISNGPASCTRAGP
jgi:hypothetical protein